MKYLVDANVLSEPTRASPNAKVVDWLRRNERQIVVDHIGRSPVWHPVVAERKATNRTRGMVRGRRSKDALLAVGRQSRSQVGGMIASLRSSGRSMPIKDSLIAATALTHGLAVVTRNAADFANAGVRTVDPFG